MIWSLRWRQRPVEMTVISPQMEGECDPAWQREWHGRWCGGGRQGPTLSRTSLCFFFWRQLFCHTWREQGCTAVLPDLSYFCLWLPLPCTIPHPRPGWLAHRGGGVGGELVGWQGWPGRGPGSQGAGISSSSREPWEAPSSFSICKPDSSLPVTFGVGVGGCRGPGEAPSTAPCSSRGPT